MLMTHTQEFSTRVLRKFLTQVSCIKVWCNFMKVLVQQTFTTNTAEQSRLLNSGHVLARNRVLFYSVQKNLHKKKRLAKKTTTERTDGQVSYTRCQAVYYTYASRHDDSCASFFDCVSLVQQQFQFTIIICALSLKVESSKDRATESTETSPFSTDPNYRSTPLSRKSQRISA